METYKSHNPLGQTPTVVTVIAIVLLMWISFFAVDLKINKLALLALFQTPTKNAAT